MVTERTVWNAEAVLKEIEASSQIRFLAHYRAHKRQISHRNSEQI